MYINLGTLRLQYVNTTDDWIILGEIIDSGMSYEKPVLVRSVDELDIWFGREFPDYNYLVELIRSGVVLYLYKPVSSQKLKDKNYIDLGEYQDLGDSSDISQSLLETDIEPLEAIRVSPDSYYFIRDGRTYGYSGSSHVVTEVSRIDRTELSIRDTLQFVYLDNLIWGEDYFFYLSGNPSNPLIWFEDQIIEVKNLQQNIYITTESYNNRDTLAITNDSTVPYVYPKFNVDKLDYSSEFNSYVSQISTSGINLDKINQGYQTYIYDFIDESIFDDSNFMVQQSSTLIPTLLYKDTITIPEKYYQQTISDVVNFSESLQSPLMGYIRLPETNHLFTKSPIDVTYFQKLPGDNSFVPNQELTYAFLSSKFKDNITIEFWGKTIGRGSNLDDSDLIEVQIEKSDEPENWRVTISRYTYSEIFEGPLVSSQSTERLDFLISRESKLVYCNLVDTSDGLQEGTYKLRGAIQENNGPDNYMYSLSQIFETPGEPVYPDYFLIPDKYKYFPVSPHPDFNYYQEYLTFLEYSKLLGCQFLIENDISPYTKGEDGEYYDKSGRNVTQELEISEKEICDNGGDFIYNYRGDKENRLLYFFRPMTSGGYERPAYYVYLRGLLNDEYQVSTKDVLYPQLTSNPYSNEEIEDKLEEYKSNYLVCNNLIYYYKKYMDGEDYITTGWMRFVASKIYREFEKNRWNYLGEKSLRVIEEGILTILNRISTSFSIIGGINLSKFTPELQKNQVTLEIEVYVNDLLKNNLKFNITLNYNKED